MSALPFSPLTHAELNSRVADAVRAIAWTVATRVQDGRQIDDDRLRALAAKLNTLHDAACSRMPS